MTSISTGIVARPNKLNRYTTLPVLLDMLTRKKIVLRDPRSWPDRNDVEALLLYETSIAPKRIFAICFNMRSETIHDWMAFADGPSGCCIEFDGGRLLHSLDGDKQIRYRKVEYRSVKEVEKTTPTLNDMPFVKRKPYRVEREFRVLWKGETNKGFAEIGLDMNSINKITLSPQISDPLANSIKRLLGELVKDSPIEINVSTLYENERWITALRKSRAHCDAGQT